jgi:hypothetical protein
MDGEYGQGVVVFESDLLTDEQWEKVTDMSASDRPVYIVAILNGDEEAIAEIEQEYSDEYPAGYWDEEE